MSFYNLPHPWDPGYAIPKYVMGEPPERGVFVTEWMPRGTIPQLQPDYLAKPGEKILGRADANLGSLSGSCLGGSSLAGSTLAGHTLRGHSLGATEWNLTPTGLGDASNGAAYGKYGQKAAAKMIAMVKRLPADKRSDALTAAMQKLDPTLPARCQKYTNEAAARGAAPAQALQAGLARAITEGLLGELAKTGRSRSAPHPDSLLGMGCIRARGALGAGETYTTTTSSGFGKGSVLSSGGGYTVQTCPNPMPGFTWVAASATNPAGHWERPKVGETPQPYPGTLFPPCGPQSGSGPAGGVVVTTTGTGPVAGQKAIEVAPEGAPAGTGFFLPIDVPAGYQIRIGKPSAIPAQWKAIIKGAWTTAKSGQTFQVPGVESGASSTTLGFTPAQWNEHVRPWLDALGIPKGTKLNAPRMWKGVSRPFPFTNPVTGKDMALSVGLYTYDANNQSTALFQPGGHVVMLVRVTNVVDPAWYQRVIGSVRDAMIAVADTVEEIVEGVVDLTCDLLNTPGAAAGAAAANPAAGAGVIIAQQTICGKSPTPPPQLPPPGPNYLVPLLVGGGVLLLVAAAAARRR